MKLGKSELPVSFFLDIDGCLLKHQGTLSKMLLSDGELVKSTIETIDHLFSKGHVIILTTGRPDSCERRTKEQLDRLGVCYHKLVMGVGIGARVIVNDLRPGDDAPTAAAICVNRDSGLDVLREF